MAPYRRRRGPWRRYRRRWRRRRNPYRRLRWPRRRWKRRFRRRVRGLRRRKKLASFWDPVNIAKCKIIGSDYGLITRDGDLMQRMWATTFAPKETVKILEGGGVSLKVFDLNYLYRQHLRFRNKWTHTNDGFDLAQYIHTKIYLKPHPLFDYIFFWDTDLKQEKQWDIMRMHPMLLLTSKNTIFVRSQVTGNNHRTKKVTIKPPANILNQWKLMFQWVDIPLFFYGFVLINWKEPYYRQSNWGIPIAEIEARYVFMWEGGKWTPQTSNFVYSPQVDQGTNNMVGVKYQSATYDQPTMSSLSEITFIDWTKNLPYWLTMFGQNKNFDYYMPPPSKEANQVWVYWYFPQWTVQSILDPTQGPRPTSMKLWATKRQYIYAIPKVGPYIMSNIPQPETRINIPLLYKSVWKWGGTDLVQQPITALNPAPNQVSVKNPGSEFRSLIYPWDVNNGVLTERALRRFLEPSKLSDERGTFPFEEQAEGYAYPASPESQDSETEETEEESDEERKNQKTLRRIRQSLLRERNKRRQLKHIFRSMVATKHTEM